MVYCLLALILPEFDQYVALESFLLFSCDFGLTSLPYNHLAAA
jgi:hypothetical protein